MHFAVTNKSAPLKLIKHFLKFMTWQIPKRTQQQKAKAKQQQNESDAVKINRKTQFSRKW